MLFWWFWSVDRNNQALGIEAVLGARWDGWGPSESRCSNAESRRPTVEQVPYANLYVVGWFRRCRRSRRQRRFIRSVGGSYPDTVAAGVCGLRRGSALQRHQVGAAGGFASVRACGAVGVAQVVLALPGGGLWGRLIHRDQRRDRTGSFGVDIPGGALGDDSGGS